MSPTAAEGPRIALIHALEESVLPARGAFARHWPQAQCFDLLDTSLATDLAFAGRLDEAMMERFRMLAAYAAGTAGRGGRVAGILFTCSAFGPAIDAVKRQLPIPVLRPNEAAFAEALDRGSRIGLVASFGPSIPALSAELERMAAERGRPVTVIPEIAEGALAALKGGDGAGHDRSVAGAVGRLPSVDVVILGQFSLARARAEAEAVTAAPVVTTPDSAVAALRKAAGGG